MSDDALRVESLRRDHSSGFTLEIPRASFDRGRIYGIVGPNGSGKTTLLMHLALMEKPHTGRVFCGGQEVTDVSRLALRRTIGFVMEDPYLYRGSVLANVRLGLRLRHIVPGPGAEPARAALARVGLGSMAARRALTLSRGETQRVALAQVLVLRPHILLLDEPFSNIDRANRTLVEKLLKSLAADENTAVVFTTHDLSQAYSVSDEVVSLINGRIVESSPENVFPGEAIQETGIAHVSISPSVRVAVVTEKAGTVHIAIPPEDIILSPHRLESSARNSFRGTITRIQAQDKTVWATVDIGVELTALITQASLSEMHLAVGTETFLTFKTTAVHVF